MLIKRRKTNLDPVFKGILHSPEKSCGKRVVVGIFNYPKHGYSLRLSSFNFDTDNPNSRPVDVAFGADTDEPHVLVGWVYQDDLLKLLNVQPLKMIEFAQAEASWLWGDKDGNVHWYGEKEQAEELPNE